MVQERNGAVVPRVKSAEEVAIQLLPVFRLQKSKAETKEKDVCSVCLTEFEEGDKVKALPCLHKFHVDEIDKWLRKDCRCPVCQQPAA